MSVPSNVYTISDDKNPVRERPESSNAGFGRPDSFMPTHRGDNDLRYYRLSKFGCAGSGHGDTSKTI